MNRKPPSLFVLLLPVLLLTLLAINMARAGDGFQAASVVGYATTDVPALTGCYSPGRYQCRTACGTYLDDRAFTVAANPSFGLGCGQRLQLCTVGFRSCQLVRVEDRTGSRFGFELTPAVERWFRWPSTLLWRKLWR